jgi:hypothetical protein
MHAKAGTGTPLKLADFAHCPWPHKQVPVKPAKLTNEQHTCPVHGSNAQTFTMKDALTGETTLGPYCTKCLDKLLERMLRKL